MSQPMSEAERQRIRAAADELLNRAADPAARIRAVRDAISMLNSTLPTVDENGEPAS